MLREAGDGDRFTRYFEPDMAIAGGVGQVFPSFKQVLPPQTGLASIVLKHGTKTLDTRVVSANAPTVTLLAPNGGETISDTFQAQWQAGDADGDPLTFSLQISRDGGTGWLPITRDITGTTYTLDAAYLPGTDHARLRVIASDGVRTGTDSSDADFTVPNHAPQLRITRPGDGSYHRADSLLFLTAEAQDREDQDIAAQIRWNSDHDGALGSGREVMARTLSVGTHTITAVVTDTGGLTVTAAVDITITAPIPPPSACTDWLTNGDFESSSWESWSHGGNPEPLITAEGLVTGTHALLLGNAGITDTAGLSWARQMVTLPEDTVHAQLSFRYRTGSRDRSADYDWFLAAVTTGDEQPLQPLRFHGGQSVSQTVTADLSQYAGQTIGLLFAVRNDGQSGNTWAFVDDVSLCVSAAPSPGEAQNTCWLPDNQGDYAPAGLPDFDQRQSFAWRTATGRWSYDGPVAVADLLWWRDSAEESGSTPPPTASDSYSLVESYGTWDDHDAQNVQPLIGDLATRMFTDQNHPGTDLDNLVAGLNTYLGSMGLADEYTLTLRKSPSFDWVRAEAKQNLEVLLLLGFWEQQPGGWKRLGGHYTAVSGASCTADGIIFSDPFRNYAEAGLPGQVAPPGTHGHAIAPPYTIHNDAAYVSHDRYGIMRTATGWGPQGYARNYDDIVNFAGLNFVPAQESARASAYLGGEIVTLADYALVLVPRSDRVNLQLSPDTNRIRAGQSFDVEIEVSAGAQTVDGVNAYLDFDPAALMVVDASGDPATQIVPGTVLTTVVTNTVDNPGGQIAYVATGEPAAGRFRVALVRFKAITATAGTTVTWSLAAPRQSDVTAGGVSVLDVVQGSSVIAGPAAVLTGTATMQGRPVPPDSSWNVPLLLTLSRPNERGPAYVFGTASDDSGAFAMPDAVAPGRYRLRLKGLHTLRNFLPITLTHGLNSANVETLLEGDARNDNRVDVRDVSLLAAAYGKSQGQPGFDPRADFNEDNTADAADLALLQTNFGRRGDVLVGVPTSGLTIQAAAKEPETLDLRVDSLTLTGTVSLRLVPAAALVSAGDVITVDVVAGAGAQPVDAVEIHLDFDPTLLQVVDASGTPATQVQPGTALPIVLGNAVDPVRGRVDFVASSVGSSPASGQFTIARVRFKALQLGQAEVRFSLSSWRSTEIISQGASVLGDVEAAEFVIVGAEKAYLPVIVK